MIINSGYSEDQKKFVKAKGYFLIDENNEKYFDFAMGAGVHIFGHRPDFSLKAIKEQLDRGSLYLKNNKYISELNFLLEKIVPENLNNFIFCNSGTEATQRAIRYSRASNNKDKIAFFEGGWHGVNEWTLLSSKSRFSDIISDIPSGIPESIYNDVELIPYNSEETWTKLDKIKDELSCILIEPLQGSNPQPNIKPFLEKLRKFCNENSINLIFDEMITGFRLAKGGAAQYFGITPDIITYGKIIGGGLPCGIVAINHNILNKTFNNNEKVMLTGGTFSANPLVAAAGIAVLANLNENFYNQLSDISLRFKTELNKKIYDKSLPFRFEGLESVNRLYFTDKDIKNRKMRDQLELDNIKQSEFRELLFRKKIIWPSNGIVCLPNIDDGHLFKTIDAIVEALTEINE